MPQNPLADTCYDLPTLLLFLSGYVLAIVIWLLRRPKTLHQSDPTPKKDCYPLAVEVKFEMVLMVPYGYSSLSDYTEGTHCFSREIAEYITSSPPNGCWICSSLDIKQIDRPDLVAEYEDCRRGGI